MSKQSISNTAPATTLPAGATIINDNFTELYNILGGSTLPTLTDGRIAFATSGAWGQSANLTFGPTAGQGIAVAAGTATTNVVAGLFTQTRNAAGVTFDGALKVVITDTASAAGSLAFQILGGAAGTTNILYTNKSGGLLIGTTTANALYIGSTNCGFTNPNTDRLQALTVLEFLSALRGRASDAVSFSNNNGNWTTLDAHVGRGGTSNAFTFTGSNAGSGLSSEPTSRTCINKAVTAFTDGVAKATFTVTIPNAAHTASIRFKANASIGAGGAIGANEASATIQYDFSISRTAGVNAVMVASTAYGSAASAVAGATTCTVTAAASAVSGAVGATNTFTINVTITKGGGSSDNHTCTCFAELLNANASGVTIA